MPCVSAVGHCVEESPTCTAVGTGCRVLGGRATETKWVRYGDVQPSQGNMRRRLQAKRSGVIDFWARNTSSKPQLESFLDELLVRYETADSEGGDAISMRLGVVVFQEHRQRDDTFDRLRERAGRRQWYRQGAAAAAGDGGGASAGSGAPATRMGRTPLVLPPLGPSHGISPDSQLGRLATAWVAVPGLPGRGTLVVTAAKTLSDDPSAFYQTPLLRIYFPATPTCSGFASQPHYVLRICL